MGYTPYNRCSSSPYACPDSNPDPERFSILKLCIVDDNLVLKVKYYDCTNFEGNKILVYKGKTNISEILIDGNKLDPHFSSERISPFARFEPTEQGWVSAILLCKTFDSSDKK